MRWRELPVKLVILVVDDEAPLLQLFARLMRHRHEVILEPTGAGALERLLSDDEIDVTFLDMMIPDVTGAEILRELRQRAPARLERIVISTGARDIPGIDELLADFVVPGTGAHLPVIDKPYGVDKIEAMLRRFTVSTAPRGPKYRPPKPRGAQPAPRRPPSLPDLDELEDVSAVTHLADIASADGSSQTATGALAIAVRDLRREVGEQRDRTKTIELHFADDAGHGKPGLVRQLALDMHAIATSLRFLKVAIPLAAILLGGLVWVIVAAAPKPSPQPDVKAIAREVARQMQEAKP